MSLKGKPIRVMTVDDHEIMRGGIRFMLLALDDIELVGESRNGEEAVMMCQDVNPDVILMDMKMSGMDGVETTSEIKQLSVDTQIIILTSFHDRDLVHRAMRAGAVGYLLKDTNMEDLAAAIRGAQAGQTTFSREAAEDLVAVPTSLAMELTERELEVLTLLTQGMSNKAIGKQLRRSPFTVRHHVSQLIKKLGASNRAEVAAIAVEQGLIRQT